MCVRVTHFFFGWAGHGFCEGFSLVAVRRGLLSSCGARASHYIGFSLQSTGSKGPGLQQLECVDSAVATLVSRARAQQLSFPGGASGKEPICQCRRHEMWVQSLGWEDPLEEGMAIHSSNLPGESHGQRSLMDYRPQGHKELDIAEVTQDGTSVLCMIQDTVDVTNTRHQNKKIM